LKLLGSSRTVVELPIAVRWHYMIDSFGQLLEVLPALIDLLRAPPEGLKETARDFRAALAAIGINGADALSARGSSRSSRSVR
jgi:hypothetical protein